MNIHIQDVLDFWYSDRVSKQWFNASPELDAEILQKFESLWKDAADYNLDSWQDNADGCLALCIVLDQFPLNMFRGENKAFQTEQQSIKVAKAAINNDFDLKIEDSEVSFLYMPLMHSEELEDQNLSVACFEKRGLEDNLCFAKHHRDLIIEFGRFPHRNEILGRENTLEEIDYLNSKRGFKG